MSARPGPWHLLGRGTDPVPGEPVVVTRLARDASSTAQEISDLTTRLESLAALEGWSGQAAQSFAEEAEDLAGELGQAERRYAEVGTALTAWARSLETARDESAAALREAQDAAADAAATVGNTLAGVEEPTDAQRAAQRRRAAAHDAAQGRLAAARRRLDDAVCALDVAAARAASDVRGGASHYRDRFWDDVKGAVRSVSGVIKAIVDVLNVVVLVIAAIALVAAFVFTLPASLLVLAAWLTVAMLAGHLLLVLSDSGQASWLDVGLDLFSLATFGLGRVLTPGLRSAVTSVRSAHAARVGQQATAAAATADAATVSARLASGVTRIPVRIPIATRLAENRLAAGAARAADAGRRAEAEVLRGAVTVQQGPLQVLRSGADAELAVLRAEAAAVARLPLDPDLAARLAAAVRPLVPLEVNAGVQVINSAADAADATGALRWKAPLVDWADITAWRVARGVR